VHILVSGFSGKMGTAIRKLGSKLHNLRFHDIEKVCSKSEVEFDLIIDFSLPSFSSHALSKAIELELPILIGTTGHDEEFILSIESASKKIPVLYEANFSKGIRLLKRTLHEFVNRNYTEVKLIRIFESHHLNKKDIPSGTALSLRDFLASMFSSDQTIEIYAQRANNIFGIHRIEIILKNEEVISFLHNAESRDIFAHGAIEAGLWLVKQKPGIHKLENIN
jgi:4-hydroxy-tetrahydrodipicolinate reductase